MFNNISIVQYLKTTAENAGKSLDELAAKLNVSSILIYIVSIMLALVAAVFGYRIIKLICAFCMEPFAFTVGAGLYFYLVGHFNLDLPSAMKYVFAILFAVLFCFLSFKKFNFIFFWISYMACFDMLLAFTNDSTLAMGGALLLALVCVALIRLVTVVATSFVGSFVIVSLTGKVFTGLAFLQLGTSDIAIIIALSLGLFLAIVQLISARYYQAR